MSSNVSVYIATHKKYTFPNGHMYIPIQVGRALNNAIPDIIGDDTGYNISYKNQQYCELTALYWIWKNDKADISGIVHYRRFFASRFNRDGILDFDELSHVLSSNDLIVSEKTSFGSFNVLSQYFSAHYIKDLYHTKMVVRDLYPDFLDSFNHVMKMSSLSMFNMFIAKRNIIDEYCQWLFDILDEVELRTNTKGYSAYQNRVFGFLSERLFNVWLYHNRSKYKVEMMPILSTEDISCREVNISERIDISFKNIKFIMFRLQSKFIEFAFR